MPEPITTTWTTHSVTFLLQNISLPVDNKLKSHHSSHHKFIDRNSGIATMTSVSPKANAAPTTKTSEPSSPTFRRLSFGAIGGGNDGAGGQLYKVY